MEKRVIEYTKVEDVKPEGSFIRAITFKPKFAPILVGAFGIAMLFINNTIVRILGAFCVLLAFVVLKEVQDYKVMDIFDKGVMFYGDREAKTACFVPYDSVKQWSVDREGGHDTLMFELTDNKVVMVDTFEASKAYRTLYSLVKEKEKNYIRLKNSKYLSIPEAFENIKKTFFKK